MYRCFINKRRAVVDILNVNLTISIRLESLKGCTKAINVVALITFSDFY